MGATRNADGSVTLDLSDTTSEARLVARGMTMFTLSDLADALFRATGICGVQTGVSLSGGDGGAFYVLRDEDIEIARVFAAGFFAKGYQESRGYAKHGEAVQPAMGAEARHAAERDAAAHAEENAHAEKLRAVFRTLASRENWKLPVRRTVSAHADIDLMREACIFMGAGVPTITSQRNGRVMITAPGYYATIGS